MFVSLQWLPVAFCIKFKALMLAFKVTNEMAPSYTELLIRPYVPSHPLQSGKWTTSGNTITAWYEIMIQTPVVLRWWYELPNSTQSAAWNWMPDNSTSPWTPQHLSPSNLFSSFSYALVHFQLFLTFIIIYTIKKYNFFLVLSLHLYLVSHLKVCTTALSDSLSSNTWLSCLACESLWIKASAKWWNVNVKWRDSGALSTLFFHWCKN